MQQIPTYFNGTHWGTICDDYFNMTTADILCRSLNPRSGIISWTNFASLPDNLKKGYTTPSTLPIIMDDVKC